MTVSHDPHIEDLLGAYALDAVEGLERAEVERHLADCPRCAREVEEHREVAAILSSGAASAPDSIWDALEDEIVPPANVIPLHRPASFPTWLAAVAAVAIFSLVGAVVFQSSRVDQLSEQVAAEQEQLDQLTELMSRDPLGTAVESALSAPDSRIITLQATDAPGAGTVRVVLTSQGTGFVLDDSLPALDGAQTYQLWAVTEGRIVSAGLFGRDVNDGAFRVDLDGLTALAITPEIAGGVVVSEAAAVSVATLEG